MGSFWETQGNDIAMPGYFSAMPGYHKADWKTFGRFKSRILPERALKLPDWETFEKLKAIILPEYASKMPGWEA